MKTHTVILLAGLMAIVGACDPAPTSDADQAQIVSSLGSRNPTTVHIALWTLEKNGFDVPDIDFEQPYTEAGPQLKELAEQLADIPQAKLTELDKSLSDHREIYSPIGFEGGDGWEE